MQTYGDHNTRLVFYDPSRTLSAICTDFLSFKANIGVLGQATLEVVIPRRSACWTNTYSGSSARADRWLNWSFDFYWRGAKVFSGPVANAKVEHNGQEASAYATLTCITWFQWLMGGRTIETNGNSPYTKTATPWDNIFKDLIRTQCVAASITKPTGFPAGIARGNFGPFTVAVSADTSSASAADWKIEQNKPLLDTLVDLCVSPAATTDHLWPTTTESPAGTFTFGCLVGRTGGSRAIGADLTASIFVSGTRGSIAAGVAEYDHEALASCWKLSGKGRAANQGFNYVTDTTVYGKIGDREDALTVRTAGTAAERQAEARRMAWLSNWENGRRVEFVLTESDALRYGVDFSVADSITVYDHVLEETSTQMITLAEISMVAPGPPHVKLGFGKMPRNETREATRSGGGGGGGGRSGGGRPKETQGEHDYIVAAGDCITVSTVEAEGQTTYTVGFTFKTWGAVTVDDGTLTPSTCYEGLEILGDRCIDVVKIDANTIHVRNTHYWFNKVTVVDPSFTLTADSCDEQVNFAGSNGISLSGSGNTITISGANINRYSTISDASGNSATASGASELQIAGADGIATLVADGSPDLCRVRLRLAATTSAEASANYLAVYDASGNKRAVKTFTATS